MSELGNRIKGWRGTVSQADFADRVGLSIRTICKIEAGEWVRLATIRRMARALKLPEAERLEWTILWLKTELGDDFRKFNLELRSPVAVARDADHLPARIQLAVTDLPRRQQEQIHLALQRPEILRCLQVLNQLYDNLQSGVKKAQSQ